MIRLVISDQEGTTTVVPFSRDQISIGRKEGNTIRLTERNISRAHCELQRLNGGFFIRDLGSYNGVVVNGQRVEGQASVNPGDQVRIGDYTVQLETEVEQTADAPIGEPSAPVDDDEALEAEPTHVGPAPRSSPPPRLVVLSAPFAGAEFSLPKTGEVRLGRAPELEIALDHRSVSREHAKIACDGNEVRIIDQGSVNGVVVNREQVSDARLAAGDVIELGDVALRFVGPGEQYVFDPADAVAMGAGAKRARARRQQLAAFTLVAAGLLVAWAITRGGPTAPGAALESTRVQAVPSPAVVQAAAPAIAPDAYDGSLRSCGEAVEGGRYAEAMAHASTALQARPGDSQALECQRTARIAHEQEQIFVRGKAALASGDQAAAWNELSSLSAVGPVRQRAEVTGAVETAATARLDRAESLLHKRPGDAESMAQSVLALSPLAPALHERARGLLDALQPEVSEPEQSSTRRAGQVRAKPTSKTATKSDEPSPMEVASACLAKGDNPCVIRALSGRAQTPQEMGLLIETYRAMGSAEQAERVMAVYVQRFPTARRAAAYREILAQ